MKVWDLLQRLRASPINWDRSSPPVGPREGFQMFLVEGGNQDLFSVRPYGPRMVVQPPLGFSNNGTCPMRLVLEPLSKKASDM
jgi:hypothetical protein